jgi:hypothetical protein
LPVRFQISPLGLLKQAVFADLKKALCYN